jgi:hypothetical protein
MISDYKALLLLFVIIIALMMICCKTYFNRQPKDIIYDEGFIPPQSKNIREYKYFEYYKNIKLMDNLIKNLEIFKKSDLAAIEEIYNIYTNPCYIARISNNSIKWFVKFTTVIEYENKKSYSVFIQKNIEDNDIVLLNIKYRMPGVFRGFKLLKRQQTIYDHLINNELGFNKIEMGLDYFFKIDEIKIYPSYFEGKNGKYENAYNKIYKFDKSNFISSEEIEHAILYYNKINPVNVLQIKTSISTSSIFMNYNNLIIASRDFVLISVSSDNYKIENNIIKINISNKDIYRFLNNLMALSIFEYYYLCTDTI